MATGPEEEFLRACIQTFLNQTLRDQSTPDDLELRATAVRDWPRFLALAEEHSLTPLVARSLKFREDLVPVTVLRQCQEQYRRNAKRLMIMTGELKRVVPALHSAGIDVVVLKGLALAYSLYPDPALRVSDDLDLLVTWSEVPAARRVLAAQGYLSFGDKQFVHAQDAFLHRYTELHLTHNVSGINIDLHWDLMPAHYPATMTPGFRERAETTNVEGLAVRTLSSSDYHRYLCLHAGKHHWSSLKWLVDLSLLTGCVFVRPQGTGPSPFAAARYWFYLVLVPTPADWASLRLPQFLYFLYFPWRWCRLLAKRFRFFDARTHRASL